jgi:hypothetical protein
MLKFENIIYTGKGIGEVLFRNDAVEWVGKGKAEIEANTISDITWYLN